MRENGEQIDTSIRIVTPENVTFTYRVAGPFRRLPAYIIDQVIVFSMMFIAWAVLAILSGLLGIYSIGMGVTLVFSFGVYWFYGGVFEALWNGQTPGKRLMRIRVLSADGQPITALQAILRNIFRVVDAQPLCLYQVGFLSSVANDRFQRLGDLACRTMVVVEERSWFQGIIQIKEPGALRLADSIPADFRPSTTTARAVSAYVNRRDYFSAARRAEIARHVGEPLRRRFGLPVGVNLDYLLCAVYHRAFVTERQEGEGAAS